MLATLGNRVIKTIVLIVLLLPACLNAQITWTKVTPGVTDPPYFNQWHWVRYNNLNGVTMFWVADNVGGRSSIYSDSLWYFDASTTTMTKIGTNNQPAGGDCVQSTATWPASRHPAGQMFWDSKRHRLISVQGVCGTINQLDMWYFQPNASLSNQTWT